MLKTHAGRYTLPKRISDRLEATVVRARSAEPACSKMPALPLSERCLMVLLITTNILNYIDRGVVPGASGAFDSFIEGSENTWGTCGRPTPKPTSNIC